MTLGRLDVLAVRAARAELAGVPAAAASDRRIRGLRPSVSTPTRCRPCRPRRPGCASRGASRPRRGRTRAGFRPYVTSMFASSGASAGADGKRARIGPAGGALPLVLVAQPRARNAPGAIEPRGVRDRILVRHRGHRKPRPVLLRSPRPALVTQPLAGLGGVRPRRRRQGEPPPPRPDLGQRERGLRADRARAAAAALVGREVVEELDPLRRT